MRESTALLLTSVGRRVELVRHLCDAAEAFGPQVRIVGTDRNPDAPAARYLGSHFHQVPSTASADYIPRLQQIARDDNVVGVFPLIDPDVTVLAQARTRPGWDGAAIATVQAASADVVADKWETHRWLEDCGLPTVPSFVPGESRDGLSYPLFIKPRMGSGGKDGFRISSDEELSLFSRRIESPIAQTALPGPEVTVDAIVGPTGSLLATVQRQRLAVRGGEVSVGVTVCYPDVDALVRRVIAHLEPRGPVTVQFMSDGAQWLITEINARMGGGLPLAVAAGVPLGDILLGAWCRQDEFEAPAGGYPYQSGLTMSRYDESMFFQAQTRG